MATHTVRLNDDLTALIAEEATRQRKESGANVTKSDIIREALEDHFDSKRLKRINASIEKMKRDYGELTCWRCEGGYIAIDLPSALVTSINREYGAKRDTELRLLMSLIKPQLERIHPNIILNP